MLNYVIEKLHLHREEIDSKENAIDQKHDLPVYRRIKRLLGKLDSYLDDFDDERKSFCSFAHSNGSSN